MAKGVAVEEHVVGPVVEEGALQRQGEEDDIVRYDDRYGRGPEDSAG